MSRPRPRDPGAMNSRYRFDRDAIRALFDEDQVHRDVYLSDELFQLERERLFDRVWIFLGHASQVPNAGDFTNTSLFGQPLLMVRQIDGSVQVLANRCSHKGTQVTAEKCGNAKHAFMCPYHGWSYKLDGSLISMPVRGGYEGTRLHECKAGKGLHRVASAVHRGFVFVQLDESGPSFQEYFGSTLSYLDKMADRSPLGELELAGDPLRTVIDCNWKTYIENINDAVHTPFAHEPSARAASSVWAGKPKDEPKPMAIEQLMPFDQVKFEARERMGCQVFPNGHSLLGSKFSAHATYSDVPGYADILIQAHGAERAGEVLGFKPQNVVLYPSIGFKTSIQVMRVLRPLAAERTILEAWAFRPKGAPDELAERSTSYNRIVFSPMSLVSQDDIHMFETLHSGLRAPGNEWISLHRGYDARERASDDYEADGLNEVLMRNQFRAWIKYLTADTAQEERK